MCASCGKRAPPHHKGMTLILFFIFVGSGYLCALVTLLPLLFAMSSFSIFHHQTHNRDDNKLPFLVLSFPFHAVAFLVALLCPLHGHPRTHTQNHERQPPPDAPPPSLPLCQHGTQDITSQATPQRQPQQPLPPARAAAAAAVVLSALYFLCGYGQREFGSVICGYIYSYTRKNTLHPTDTTHHHHL